MNNELIHLIYVSTATSWPSEDDLLELLTQARHRNEKKNITGMLLYDHATYLQVLEGSSEDVHDIYNSILKDPRNTQNVILSEELISHRDFPQWSMGFKNLESCSPQDLPGFSDIFKGKLDNNIATENIAVTKKLLMNFASISDY